MAKFSKVKKGDMPKVRRQGGRLAARMREYDEYILSLKPDEAGMLEPGDDEESVRGLALRISRAGKRLGKKLDVRSTEKAVYFSLLD
ncbi:MAG: hypothetical protein IT303_00785 [Dehalococcoidia bacterium]|nr:hypothetical protein [Dehalococcoidia bacterium]